MPKLKVLDLFSGIGGFSLGLERTGGFETVAFCEIEDYPRKVLAKHWPGVPIYDDVRTLTADRLAADGITGIDVITGGFPCQDLSSAGQRAGISGERSGLWGELYRLACQLRPRFTMFENVTGLLNGDDGRWFHRLLQDMAEGGFNFEWECIPASSIGAPHHRDRVYGVAYPGENGRVRIFSQANLKVSRDMGDYIRADWFGCGEGAWADWQTKTREEIFSQSIIARADDGIPGWMDRNSALGNSVVPQIPEAIGEAILKSIGWKHGIETGTAKPNRPESRGA